MLKELFNEMINTGRQLVENKNEYQIMDINGSSYIHKMPEKIYEQKYENTNVNTLSGLVDYINSEADESVTGKTMILHVLSPEKVKLMTEFNRDRSRDTIITANALLPGIQLNTYVPLEEMNIMLQSAFEDSIDRSLVLQAISSVKMTDSIQLADDGISQKVTISKGDELFDKMTLPNPVSLRPFRTFTEIPMPECLFVFRMKEGHAALFDADGGAWRLNAVLSIKSYLEDELSLHSNVKIIA